MTEYAVNQIHCVDALIGLRSLPAESVDCVVTSPPYNLGTQTNGASACSKSVSNWGRSALLNGGYAAHDDALPYDEYVSWQRAILSECMRALKPDGAIFYNQKWRIQGGLLDTRAEITTGFPVRQVIIWDRGGGLNHNRAFFTPSYEVVYLIANRDFYLVQSEASRGDVWHIPPEVNNDHPAPFPVELARRCIASTTARFILDPFMGSGTTAVAAQALGREWLGFELSDAYCRMARRRLGDMSASEPLDTLPIFAALGEE